MKSSYTLALIAVISLLFAFGFSFKQTVHKYLSNSRSPCDAPLISAGWTGAPGDGSCANSGCHSGGINNGPGVSYLLIGNGDNLYSPGTTYLISLGLEQTDIDKFGFQITNRSSDTDQFEGDNDLTDPLRTRLISGGKYVGTNACGSDADSTGQIAWEFEWTAPDQYEGEITFYANFIATNHNHSSSGDDTYELEVILAPDGVNSISEIDPEEIQIFPNPVIQYIDIPVICEDVDFWKYEIFDLSGKTRINGTASCKIDVGELAKGYYLLKLVKGENIRVKKFFKLDQ
ncbi:MAG: T9SS type A sorting domain-containing protein [Flavobacteriales bacterium]|nr:T9SS type A sorting domain-containing protein [Flavobacteriales bacterium]